MTRTHVRVFFVGDGLAPSSVHVYMYAMTKRSRELRVYLDTRGRRLLVAALMDRTEASTARAVGVAQQQVSSWKRGQTRPKPEHREALRRVLGIPIDAWYTTEEAAVARGDASTTTLAAESIHAGFPHPKTA